MRSKTSLLAHLVALTLFVLSNGTPWVEASVTTPVSGGVSVARPRVVVLNDIPPLDVVPTSVGTGPADHISDPDSLQSAIRFLLYANEFDVEALIQTSGTWANVADKKNVIDLLDVYGQVYDNLRQHDDRYPTANHLKEITYKGIDKSWGEKDVNKLVGESKDSEASEAIIRIVDNPDPRPVWFCCGGGSCDIAQAIWRVRKSRTPQELQTFIGKMRLYVIAKQDSSTQWLLDNFPDLFIILSENNYMGMFWYSWGSTPTAEDAKWVAANLGEKQGPLATVYPRSGADATKPGVVEGDSPAFLHLLSAVRGLNDPEQPSQWGWGGKFVQPDRTRKHWFDHSLGGEAVWHWRSDFQADFATRISWMSAKAAPALEVVGNQLTDTNGNNVRLTGWHQTTGTWFSGYGKFFKNGDADGCSLYLRRVVDLFTDPSPRYGYNHGWYFDQVRLGSSEDFHGSYLKGSFNLANFKLWVDRVLVPFASYCETKGVYVTVFPDVGVPEHTTVPALQTVLLQAWGYISSHPQLKNKENVMFELCNEPISAQAPDGSWSDHGQKYSDALRDWLQPVVDQIRANGANNVIWIPGLGYQGHFEGFEKGPVKGTNIGYAVHIYPGYWDNTGPVGNDVKRIRALWNDRYAPAGRVGPLNITETWWLRKQTGDDPYWGLFDGVTGTNDSGFGSELFRIVEDAGNLSFCLHHSMTLLGKGPTAEVSDPDGVLGWQEPVRDSAVLPFFHRQFLWRNWGPRAAAPTTQAGQFCNLSVRSSVGAGDSTLILGFVVSGGPGTDTLPLLLRAAGPSLKAFGLEGVVSDPALTVFAEQSPIASNDNWGGDDSIAGISAYLGAFSFADKRSSDAALYRNFDPGAYTFHIKSNTAESGIALGEIYSDRAFSGPVKLVNISARSFVGKDSNVLIAGFTIAGTARKTVLVRGVGPSLKTLFSIEGALAETSLSLYASDIKLQESHVWGLSSNSTQINEAARTVGGFELPLSSRDSVILCTLDPGGYTAILSGLNNTEGVGLVEVYEVQE